MTAPKLSTGTLEAAADFLALGLDPDRSIFWVQSDVPEVIELSWISDVHDSHGIVGTVPLVQRPRSREASQRITVFSHILCSWLADILLYQSHIIPVGKDQKQHVEVTRDIAIKFNSTFGETFVLPEPQISDRGSHRAPASMGRRCPNPMTIP